MTSTKVKQFIPKTHEELQGHFSVAGMKERKSVSTSPIHFHNKLVLLHISI